MPTWRSDPLTGGVVIIAEGRIQRPVDYAPPPALPTSTSCPFCEGNEATTPPEVAARRPIGSRPNDRGWSVRVIPNKFPTFEPGQGAWERAAPLADPFHPRPALGVHEVVIQSPRHAPGFPFLTEEHIGEILEVYRERVRELERIPGVGTLVWAENYGPDSGGSLIHPHAQLLATPERVHPLEVTLERSTALARAWGVPCATEALLATERSQAQRMVYEEPYLNVVAPFASDVPYHLRLSPTRHLRSPSEANDAELRALGLALARVERALLRLFPEVSYNVSSLIPPPSGDASAFHWSVDLRPRLVKADAFELATHVPVNPIPPEVAAEKLRGALASSP